MKIGDKVRFVSEIGGGIVAGFQGKNIVLVEDEDGFQIPTAINDVVVIDSDNYEIRHDSNAEKTQPEPVVVKPIAQPEPFYEDEPEEREGGDVLSVYVAYVPVDIKELIKTKFETYIVNDSNYYIHYTYLTADGAGWKLRFDGEIEPNTKVYLDEFERDVLNEMERISVQLIAYKREKNFMLKPPVDAQIRIDTVKFYKLHTFQENEFFEQLALIYPIIENDKPVRPLVIDAKKLKQEMARKIADDTPKPTIPQSARKKGKDDPVVVDLHSSALLDTTAGMTPADILNYQLGVFKKTMDKFKNNYGTKLIFIHGKGEGVLRHAILHELNYRYKKCPYQDASFREYGYGATQVTIK
ncbi:MAG: DUF2027 domain-containing protein [Prevotella sp.]|nr:DUF2027 domain-containing protein [Prevotella sp.]